ncbi:hypothetical protein VOLCADRAFT_97319 [Volvox carteri f. nagariensis]|uniref:Uncharacterized protein n=1 Tax=Volvox carteri f. nagariensis TaxID=3068 RepID=D8UCF9_VOLCA|nr:uncharacterized protein VOLCADRAFT_97319 [Volvox carteri f. nagariensis]EFJ42544.1 hypothetical protein VOLCADRAFT_97319 [Volvox carteri f. nagariensis]|eukprot:XP_002956400.1 hypothetical protein VOLCADRAFT_97319 [Volvox carteri f. nagariensis]
MHHFTAETVAFSRHLHAPTRAPQLPTFPPSYFPGNLLDVLKELRLARGDHAGAARVDSLRQWFSFFGLYRGLPALGMDLYRHKSLAREVYRDWTQLLDKVTAAPGGGLAGRGWDVVPELLAANPDAVLQWVRQTLRKVRKAFKGFLLSYIPAAKSPPPPAPPHSGATPRAPKTGGAVSRLLADCMGEVSTDPHFISDLMAAAEQVGWKATVYIHSRGDGSPSSWLPEQLTELSQQVFEIVR